jgi:hypothetical protein
MSNSRRNWVCLGISRYRVVDNWRYIVTTFSELKPGFMERNRENPLINKPAPTSSTKATASSDVTRIFRMLSPIVLAVVLRPLSFKAPATSARVAIHTGAIPNRMPVSTETTRTNSRTLVSI